MKTKLNEVLESQAELFIQCLQLFFNVHMPLEGKGHVKKLLKTLIVLYCSP